MSRSGRDTALKVLSRVERNGAFAAAALSSELADITDKREAGLAFEIVYGVLRMRPWLDYLLSRVSERGLDKMNPEVMRILRVGAYQIAFLERVPLSAAVFHAVEATRRSRAKGLLNMVNAVLRKLAAMPRNELLPGIPETGETDETIALLCGQPAWLVRRILEAHGEKTGLGMIKAFNRAPRRTLRININRVSREDALPRLGRSAVSGTLSPWSVDVDDARAARLAVSEGWAAFQDEAAQLAVLALDPRREERILDACSGRGGKTGAISMATGGEGDIVAADRSESKLQRLMVELHRQGLKAKTTAVDLTAPGEKFGGSYDKILLDAPCSGSGTLGRRPEIRWRLSEEDIFKLCSVQADLLDTCASALAPGGRLVYVVCSLLKDEGREQTLRFFERHMEFELVSSPPQRWPETVPWGGGNILVDPSKTSTDGYQLIVLEKCR